MIRKAVFRAAGFGTRFLPATKASPKEMLPLVDKPLIQYGVEEARAAGVRNMIIVTGRGKNAIEDHFDVAYELEDLLQRKGDGAQLATVRAITDMADFFYVRQNMPLGLGHAVLRTMDLVGEEPFAVVLSDDVIDSKVPVLRQMIDIYERAARPVHPTKVIGICLNTYDMDEAAARDAITKAQEETGLPATDPVRFESGPLVEAVVREARTLR